MSLVLVTGIQNLADGSKIKCQRDGLKEYIVNCILKKSILSTLTVTEV